jgi:hypothetical protein
VTRGVLGAIYYCCSLVYFAYLSVHDWALVSGWRWLLVDAFNLWRAQLWPLYLGAQLWFYGGALPEHRI